MHPPPCRTHLAEPSGSRCPSLHLRDVQGVQLRRVQLRRVPQEVPQLAHASPAAASRRRGAAAAVRAADRARHRAGVAACGGVLIRVLVLRVLRRASAVAGASGRGHRWRGGLDLLGLRLLHRRSGPAQHGSRGVHLARDQAQGREERGAGGRLIGRHRRLQPLPGQLRRSLVRVRALLLLLQRLLDFKIVHLALQHHGLHSDWLEPGSARRFHLAATEEGCAHVTQGGPKVGPKA
mmetsp:Transcript_18891/g.56635  ORF Transcript_18891/g.56635 Transcript_18891/m.56635 type:complete len:236 (-) Transcript_18891:29-736(-)